MKILYFLSDSLKDLLPKFFFKLSQSLYLSQMPQADYNCHTIIFNRNILISGYYNQHILMNSAELDSFSIIPYVFSFCKTKIIINAERLYLLACGIEGKI
ncbi:unnamed protein product [Blepharisma stoltei]|uniref:AraC family transcriptional regulator n=1 Tax=Blepharisma stoltei TaxID=1481888 RepID=A0AAU9JII1_9CILI|nr:unnamed protein product [Blepharisma stoltei]